uniref:Uncharacterized protein n=1 Tax=Anopheles coluzzii TaxID=1518534 RepID=A0A8W7PIA6_ANOCL
MGTAATAAGAVAGSNTFTSGMMMMVGLVSTRGGGDVAGGVGVGGRGDDATGGATNGVVTIGCSGTGTFSPFSVSCTCSSTSSDKGSCLSRVSSSSVGCCCSIVSTGGGGRGGCALGASTAARTVAVCTGVGSDCSTVAGATSPSGPVSVIWTGRGVGTGWRRIRRWLRLMMMLLLLLVKITTCRRPGTAYYYNYVPFSSSGEHSNPTEASPAKGGG